MHTSFRHHLPKRLILCAAVLGITALTACGKGSAPADSAATSGTMGESATDLAVNLAQLVTQNPDIFGWLYIPETPIDAPLLQSMTGEDTWYLTHDCTGAESGTGAMFIEAGNLLDMCDFNTIVNGYGGKGGCFESLWQFADADYFAGHEQFYIVIDGNALTYEIWTAYEREDTSLLRSYDLTSEEGCTAYLADMQKEQVAGRAHIRPGWEEGVSTDNFLVTLTATDSAKPGRQFVVQGCLIDDQAGTIRR
ncbi:MAG: class B sortase [Butyrivibrio sp.]|nr:class B sortase [Butyrivibrio sp.]